MPTVNALGTVSPSHVHPGRSESHAVITTILVWAEKASFRHMDPSEKFGLFGYLVFVGIIRSDSRKRFETTGKR